MRSPFEVDLATFEARVLPVPPSTTQISALDLKRAEQKIVRIAEQFQSAGQEEALAFELESVFSGLTLPNGNRVNASIQRNAHDEDSPVVPSLGLYSGGRVAHRSLPDWNTIRVWVCLEMVDPRRTNDEARDIIESVVREVFARQPRRWFYSIHLLEGGLYCFRRDRSGTIVSKDVAMAEDPGMLVRLLWRFSQMTDEQLGLDPTASTVDLGSPYFALMEDTREDKDGQDIDLDACEMDPFETDHRQPSSTGPCVFAYQRRLFADSLTDDWPRYALEVGTERRKYLVGKPTYIADAHSTGTLVYIALDPIDRSFVTLKDKWRPLSADFESEGAILRTLQSRGVGGVPSAVRYGDIEGHDTWLELYSEENVRRKRKRDDKGTYKTPRPFERLQHCRLVEKEVFLPLDEFTCSFQLLRVISDCIRIHRASYEAGYLQRDVNPSNIMIRPSVSVNADGKRTVHYTGVLIDWDLACRVQEGHSVQPYPPKPRSLTSWPFHCSNPFDIPSGFRGDLESFFLIMLYYAMRFVHNNCEPRLETYVRSIFYSFDSLVGLCAHGARREPWSWWKVALMSSIGLNFYRTPLQFHNGADKADTSHPIQALLYELRGLFSLWYNILRQLDTTRTFAQKRQEQGLPPKSSPPSEKPDVEELVRYVTVGRKAALSIALGKMSEENLQAAAEQAVSYDRMLSIIDGALQRTSAWSAHDRAPDLLGGRQLDFVYAPGVVFPKEVHPDLYPVKRQKCEEIRTSCPDDDPPHWRHVMY